MLQSTKTAISFPQPGHTGICEIWDVEVSGTMTMIRSPSYDGISPMEKNKSVQEQGIPKTTA